MLERSLILLVLILAAVTGAGAVTCTVTSSGIAFGAYSGVSTSNSDSTGSITVRCVTPVAARVTYQLHLGAGGSGAHSGRQLGSGNNRLNYNLYTEPLRRTVWGDGNGGTSRQGFSSTIPPGETVTEFVVYSRIPPGQRPRPGVYTDSLIVSIMY
jgi:spore coat protein U-like protein